MGWPDVQNLFRSRNVQEHSARRSAIRMNQLKRNCAGMARRDFIQIGLGATIGLSFTNLLQLRAQGASAAGKVSPDHVNCIMIWLDGGPSHYETFDTQPDAPKGIPGELSS